MTSIAIVIPTIGRPSLQALFGSLKDAAAACDELIVVDDRTSGPPLELRDAAGIAGSITVVHSLGKGPAGARNLGWRQARSEWVCFLDDDVVVTKDWMRALREDLGATSLVAGSQGIVEVPLPQDRPPTDWERNVAGLARAAWITADMAYRRDVLERVGGFDERFPRAYREDSDLALRVQRCGGRLVRGRRRTLHPVREANRWISLRLQRGNADDVLMRALHGPYWREMCSAGSGRLGTHAAIVAGSVAAIAALIVQWNAGFAAAGVLWALLVGVFAYERIAPGPRNADEIVTMVLTSAAIPYAAVFHTVRGLLLLPVTLRRNGA